MSRRLRRFLRALPGWLGVLALGCVDDLRHLWRESRAGLGGPYP